MKNRRIFIKQLVVTGIASNIPSVLIAKPEPSQTIRLLVRGDDMGKNYGRTVGFIKSFNEGILTSASIMATSVYFEESIRFCKENPNMCAGVHLTLADGTQRPVLSPEEVPSLVTPKGFFYESAAERPNNNMEEMENEIRAQIGKARAMGLNFVYLDNHRGGGEDEIIRKVCKEQKLVYGRDYEGEIYGYKRLSLMRGEKFPSQVLPDGSKAYYAAPAITEEEKHIFFDNLNNLKPGKWVMVCHPGWADPNRASATELLCSPQTKEIIKKKNIQLVNYKDLWEEEYGN